MTKDPRQQALADQLRAEIAGSKWKSVARFHPELVNAGVRIEYTGLTKKVSGKEEIPMRVLLPALDILGVDYLTFVTNAWARLQRPQD